MINETPHKNPASSARFGTALYRVRPGIGDSIRIRLIQFDITAAQTRMLQFGSVAGSVRPKVHGDKGRKIVTFLRTTQELKMTLSWIENPRVRVDSATAAKNTSRQIQRRSGTIVIAKVAGLFSSIVSSAVQCSDIRLPSRLF